MAVSLPGRRAVPVGVEGACLLPTERLSPPQVTMQMRPSACSSEPEPSAA